MNGKFHAKLNEDNVCTSITTDIDDTDGHVELEGENIFQLSKQCLGKKYKDGAWEEVDPMYFYHPLSEQEAASLQMQSDLEYLVCLKELGL